MSAPKEPKARKYNLRTRLVAALRDEWRRSPNRYAVVREARVAPAHYVCLECLEIVREESGKPTPYRIDHVDPVVPLTGFTHWNEYIARLFCAPEGLQLLCIPCHDEKTARERGLRKMLKELGLSI